MIKPHGGKLVNLVVEEKEAAYRGEKIHLPVYKLRELENIATGVFSPLEGFMGEEDYKNVLRSMRLKNGTVWTVPVILPVDQEAFRNVKIGETAVLADENGTAYGEIDISDKFSRDRESEAESVFGTKDENHPGAARVLSESDLAVGGKIRLFRRLDYGEFERYRLDPKDTRRIFEENGWKTVVAFQTRNPLHRAHEYLQKVALEMVDGLFLNPLVGETKAGDLPAGVRMKTYETLLENYYPKNRTLLGLFTANMFYAGPKEAVFHAICRKNYGCTHFIVGRDHAGVGKYYGTYDAQNIFGGFEPSEIGIEPLKFENAFYCRKCGAMATSKTCPHGGDSHIYLSGTKVREILSKGEMLPVEFMRPEISEMLIAYYSDAKTRD